jgi:hypothetical protein
MGIMNYKHKVDTCLNSVRDKLPYEVCIWSDNHIQFIFVEPCNNIADEMFIGKAEYIVNIYKRVCRITTDLLEATIAHEIAHCWLGHKSNYHTKVKELESDKLTEQWGFDILGLNQYLKTHRL